MQISSDIWESNFISAWPVKVAQRVHEWIWYDCKSSQVIARKSRTPQYFNENKLTKR